MKISAGRKTVFIWGTRDWALERGSGSFFYFWICQLVYKNVFFFWLVLQGSAHIIRKANGDVNNPVSAKKKRKENNIPLNSICFLISFVPFLPFGLSLQQILVWLISELWCHPLGQKLMDSDKMPPAMFLPFEMYS